MSSESLQLPKIGLLLPAFEGAGGDPAPGWRDLLDLARRAEAAGFGSLWLMDHLLSRDADGSARGFWECWSLLAALAATTAHVPLWLEPTTPATVEHIGGVLERVRAGRD